jgi:putative endopeptidase
MDTLTIEKRGYAPIKPLLSKIDAITDLPSLTSICLRDRSKVDNQLIIGFSVSLQMRKIAA